MLDRNLRCAFSVRVTSILLAIFPIAAVGQQASSSNSNKVFVGINVREIGSPEARQLGVNRLSGAVISKVFPNSPAEQARLRAGDVVVKCSGRQIRNCNDLSTIILASRPGDRHRVEFYRGNNYYYVDLVLGRAPSVATPAPTTTPVTSSTDTARSYYTHPQNLYRIPIPAGWQVLRGYRNTAKDPDFDTIASPDRQRVLICWRGSEAVTDILGALEKYAKEKQKEVEQFAKPSTNMFSTEAATMATVTYNIDNGRRTVCRTSMIREGRRTVINTIGPAGDAPGNGNAILSRVLFSMEAKGMKPSVSLVDAVPGTAESTPTDVASTTPTTPSTPATPTTPTEPSPPTTPTPPAPDPSSVAETTPDEPITPTLPAIPMMSVYAPEIPPTKIAPFLSLNEMTATMWAGAVSAAMEGVRLVNGPMTEEETLEFEESWAPMFDFPFQEGVDYLNELNPLLGQYLSIRTVMIQTAVEFDEAWQEATIAAALHEETSIRSALAIAWQRRTLLIALQKQMEQVVKAIEELGPPPNPLAELARRRKRFRDMVNAARPYPKGVWVLTKQWMEKKVDEEFGDVNPMWPKAFYEAKLGGYSLTTKWNSGGSDEEEPDRIVVDNSRDDSAGPLMRHSFRFDWKPMPDTIPPMTEENEDAAKWEVSWQRLQDDREGPSRSYGGFQLLGNVCDANGKPIKDFTYLSDYESMIVDGKERECNQTSTYTIGQNERESNKVEICCNLYGPYVFDEEAAKQTYRITLVCNVEDMPQYMFHYLYRFDSEGTGPDTMDHGFYSDENTAPDRDLVGDRSTDPKYVREQIEFHEGTIKLLEGNLAREKAEIARTSDEKRRGELLRRMIMIQANIQAEKDRITTIKTGEPVHTRTAWDEATRARFIEQCHESARKMDQDKRRYDGMQRMIDRADPPYAYELRKMVYANIGGDGMTCGNPMKLEELSKLVFESTQKHLRKKMEQSHEAAALADRQLKALEMIKTGSEVALMFYTFGGGGSGVMMAYQGGLGFVEGAPPTKPGDPTDPALGHRIYEGTKRALMWYNTATYVAAEAMEGYEKGGYIGGQTGAWGAVERAGEAFLMAKSIEYGVGKLLGAPPKGGRSGPPRRTPITVQEQFELARYQQQMSDGLSLVDDYARAVNEYRVLRQSGGNASKLQAMEEALRQKAASIHSSMEAKLIMKRMQSQQKNLSAIDDYIARVCQNHSQTEQRFREIMESKYKYSGVDQWKFKQFRNASSGRSVGMDYDTALEEAGRFIKKGSPVNIHTLNTDAQKAWNEAYRATTGYSPHRSFETFTSSTHVEAYRDLAWLGGDGIRHANVNEIRAAWSGQAADITAIKAREMLNSPHLSRLQGIAEASRGMTKDIRSKLLHVMEKAAQNNPRAAGRIREQIQYWDDVATILSQAGDDPIRAAREIRLHTGHDLAEVVGSLRDVMANYGHAVGQPMPSIRP